MAALKQQDLFDVLTGVPAWVGPVLAAGALVLVGLILPASLASSISGAVDLRPLYIPLCRGIGGFLALAVLVTWLAAEFHKWRRRRLLGDQSGLPSIRGLSWQQFEQLVAEAYQRQGYAVDVVANPAGDGGVDLVLHRGGEKVLVQCKRWRAWRVGVKVVRELLGVGQHGVGQHRPALDP